MKTIYFLAILGVFLPLHGTKIPTLKQLIIQKYLTNSATTPHPEFITADLHDAIWDQHPAKDYFNQLSPDQEPIKIELASKETGFFAPDLNVEAAVATQLEFDNYKIQLSNEAGKVRIDAIPKATITLPKLSFNHPGAHTLHKENDYSFTSIGRTHKKTWELPHQSLPSLYGQFKLQKLLIQFYHEKNFEKINKTQAFLHLPVHLQKSLEKIAENQN